jgi:hypothetical protein
MILVVKGRRQEQPFDWRLENSIQHHFFRALAAGEIEEDGLAKWFSRHLKKTQ